MIGWILAVLALFVVQTLIPPTMRYYLSRRNLSEQIRQALGPRDAQPPLSPAGERAKRALNNMFEALPVFLTLAILIHIEKQNLDLARTGAAIFLGARIAYVPVYIAGISGLRSAIWSVSWIGLATMIAALLR